MPSLKEVAKLAGVSLGTVSNVISGTAPVSDGLRSRVLKAIQALNYRPNLIARKLRLNRTQTMGIIVPSITVPFFAKVIRGAGNAARRHGYFVIVVESEGSAARERELLDLLELQRVDGILIVITAWREPGVFLSEGVPVVFVDRLPAGLEVDSVCVDDRAAADMAVTHLLEKGHRRIALLTGPLTLKNEQERLRGYRQALRNRGVCVDKSLIWSSTFDVDKIADLCQRKLRAARRRPTALLATNGAAGMGGLRGIFAAGLSTPEDIALVTFDELTSERIFRPAVTAVVQPATEIGVEGMEILIDRVTSPLAKGPVKKVRLTPTLAIRESSDFRVEELGKSRSKSF